MAKETIVVNLFGGPGAGKSTGAAYIFAMLKMEGIDVELVTEFAKDKVWEENYTPFDNQAYVFGKQSYKIGRCAGKVNVIVTDSPLPMSIHYAHEDRLTDNFTRTVLDVFNSYTNMNYLITRVVPYDSNGRYQTESEADQIAEDIQRLLQDHGIQYVSRKGTRVAFDEIVVDVIRKLRVMGVID